ncbi:hypothetical protein [Dyadobacter alkalitolerans]|uniref:hypothetical protein n=1 Tax=Dyadobacter alkalitolerans TaxID=492736 RepID=UPI00047DA589|nr:hypothetical protein [Dyadobacter alkalitolerans]
MITQNQPAADRGTKKGLGDLFTSGGFRKLEGTCYSRPLDKPNKKKAKGSNQEESVAQKAHHIVGL